MVYILTKKDSPLVLFSGSKVKEQLNFEVMTSLQGPPSCIIEFTGRDHWSETRELGRCGEVAVSLVSGGCTLYTYTFD